MNNARHISILGIISLGLIFSLSFFNFATLIPDKKTDTLALINPKSSSIDPFLYEDYLTIGGSYIAISSDIKLDSSNNIYITGSLQLDETEDTEAFLAKFDNTGSQLWFITWGGDYADSGGGIAFDSTGNVYMGGSTSSFGPAVPDANWFLAKFDSSGNQLWNYSWGTGEGEWGGAIVVDSADYIYYTGSTWGHGGPSANVGLIKFSSAGVLQWDRYWGPGGYDSPRDIAIDASDNIYIIAGSDTRSLGGRDVALIKYNSAGTLQWDTAWGGTGYDDPRGMTLDTSGNIYITGMTDSFGVGDYDIFVTKFDGTPTQLWNFTWGGVNSDIPRAIAVDTANNMYIGGHTESFGSGDSDIVTIKYDNTRVQQWNKTWGGTGYEECTDLQIDSSNYTYITGQVNSFNTVSTNVLLLKYNNSGNEEWYKSWDGESRDECREIAFDLQGNYYLAGFTETFGGMSADSIVIKYNQAGIHQWNATWGGDKRDETNALAVDLLGNIYVTGETESFGPGDTCAFLLKYNSTGDLQWNYTWGGAYLDAGSGLVIDSSFNVYMGGSTSSFGPAVPDANWFLAKFDSSGNQLWNYSWGTGEGEWGGRIAIDSTDHIYYIGSTWGHGGPSANVGLVKFNSSGDLEWARYWGPGGYDSPRDIVIDSSNYIYIVAGSDTRGYGGRDVALIVYDDSGTLQWTDSWGSSGFDDPKALTLDSEGNIYVTGVTDSFGNGDYDVFTLLIEESSSIQRVKIFGSNEDEESRDIKVNWADDVFIGGFTESFCTGSGDMLMLTYEMDLLPPIISIIDPAPNEFCGVNGPDYEIIITEDNPDTLWYTLDGGITNVSLSGLIGTIDQTEWSKCGNGTVDITIYARDLSGFELFETVTVKKDIIAPVSEIDYTPYSGTNQVIATTPYTLSASDGGGCGVAVIRYRIDSDTWTDYTGAFTLGSLSPGSHQIEFYSVDDLDNVEDIQSINVQLIELPPEISGYNLLILLSIIGIVTLLLLRKKFRSKF
ncbi:MAG: hypothetical protein EAX91_04370 [Candidatus Lokiarchaeota archaeon]|nr:hypothetical protein [Candidatus Lokiarchaeota archaeon]